MDRQTRGAKMKPPTSQDKPREFKLIVEDWRTNAVGWDGVINDLTTGEEIHVIEYSAYENLVIEQAAHEVALAHIGKHAKALEQKVKELESRIKELKNYPAIAKVMDVLELQAKEQKK
jgi:hypothetical protein